MRAQIWRIDAIGAEQTVAHCMRDKGAVAALFDAVGAEPGLAAAAVDVVRLVMLVGASEFAVVVTGAQAGLPVALAVFAEGGFGQFDCAAVVKGGVVLAQPGEGQPG